MSPCRRGVLLAALLSAGAVHAQGGLELESLPRPSTPPAEIGPVVPEQVLRWREEGEAAERGRDGPADPVLAAQLYCRAARYGDAVAQYDLGWMLFNGRGIQRDEAQAAHMFSAAAEQGLAQAQNMATRMGTPRGAPPPCLRPPEADPRPPAPKPGASPLTLASFDGVAEPPHTPAVIARFVSLTAPEYKLAPSLVLAVMATESNFDPLAVSARNAQGLMQLIPDTATRFKVRKLSDPVQNIRGGMAYLRWLLAYYQGNLPLVLAAYNAGEAAVDRYRGVPPYAETRSYVLSILGRLGGRYYHPFDASVTPPSPMLGTALR